MKSLKNKTVQGLRHKKFYQGVTNSGWNWENWIPISDVGVTSNFKGLKIEADGVSYVDCKGSIDMHELEKNTDYMVVFNVFDSLLSESWAGLKDSFRFNKFVSVAYDLLGLYKVLVTTEPEIEENFIVSYLRPTNLLGEFVNYQIFFYKVSDLPNPSDPLNSPLDW